MISLEETRHLVTDGTTGLQSWQVYLFSKTHITDNVWYTINTMYMWFLGNELLGYLLLCRSFCRKLLDVEAYSLCLNVFSALLWISILDSIEILLECIYACRCTCTWNMQRVCCNENKVICSGGSHILWRSSYYWFTRAFEEQESARHLWSLWLLSDMAPVNK